MKPLISISPSYCPFANFARIADATCNRNASTSLEKQGAALCGAANSPEIALRAILLEEIANAVLDHVHIACREAVAGGNLLRGNLVTLAKDKYIEVTARYVMVRLEYLERPGECLGTGLVIKGDPLESGNKGPLKFLGHGFNILGMEVGTALHVTKERPGLPAEIPEPVLFGPGELLAVRFDVLAVHELVEGKLHRVLAVGEAITAVEAVHEPGAELRVEFGPSLVVEDHFIYFFIFHTPNTIKCFQAC